MSSPKLSPGLHTFPAPNGLTFRYIVHTTPTPTSTPTPTPTATKLLLIQCPGWGMGPYYLMPAFNPLLAQNYTLLFFHPRGSAGSSRPADPSTMTTFHMAADLELFRQYLGLDQFPAMLGHSHGGTIVLAYAETFPRRVARLILIDHRLLGYDDSATFLRFRQEREGDERYAAAYHALHAWPRPATDEELGEFLSEIIPIYFYDPVANAHTYFETVGDEGFPVWCLQNMKQYDRALESGKRMVEGLKNVTAKTLMVFGKQDCQCTTENAEQTKMLGVHHADVVLLDQCGHFPWLEKPDETLRAIKDFLTG
ncbi:hypothetical protein AJ79_02572 [Helicocarpus griseus UAMH5409]|uniref:AB hydrolase-1 domain-containing protein n=1 Tax=Helicocarpus griseus UAMH5409 TaxID=1447875 RepID=A0A2B7Y3D7_9EURO|nr:hypothetical protein AJ79_02572 [Helicocarpus griseus UAMH5409]